MSGFATDRLTFRSWEESDLDRLLDMYSRPEVVRYLGTVPKVLTDIEDARNLVQRWRSQSADPRFGFWAAQRSDGLMVGTVLLIPVIPSSGHRPNGEVEVGWHLHPDSRRHGYATEMGRGAIEKGFADGLSEIYAYVKPKNTASIEVCRRLGMDPLGLSDPWDDGRSEIFRTSQAIKTVRQ